MSTAFPTPFRPSGPRPDAERSAETASPTEVVPAEETRRILVLNYEYPPIGGGASPVTASVAAELASLGHRLDVVTMAFGDLPAFEDHGRLRVHRVNCLRASRHICRVHELASYIPAALRKARALLREDAYDLVHSHFFLPCGIVARRLRRETGVPYVITAHGSDVRDYNPDRFRLLHPLLAPLWARIARDARAITSPSESLAGLIRRHFDGPIDVQIIPNGIPSDWIDGDPTAPETKWRRILLVSRLFERKGAQYLLRALRDLRTGWDVHVVGEGPHRGALEALANDVPDPVVFHGWLENDSRELLDLYRTASIFVFPSTSENFPISLLEAMVSATAVVATDLGACREVLGDAAAYFPVGDVARLRETLHELIENAETRRDLGRRARKRALEDFTWTKLGRRYHDLFVELTPRA